LIDTPSGSQVRLRDIAAVRIAPNPTVIRHDAVSRYIDVTATVAGRDVDAVATDIRGAVKDVAFPLEYHAELQQGHTERQDAERRLLGLALAAVIGIFLLLQAAFGSWRLAALLFGALPLTLLGGALAAVIFVGDIALGALIGFLGVLAVSVRQSIMLITHLQEVQREDGQTFGPDLVAGAARERLAPILVTALATAAALAPLAIARSGPGHEILHPMAIVMLGGLMSATLVTLFLLPSLYLLVGGSPLPAPRGAPLEMSPVVGSPAD
jgi:Cu/Ag efflux pump CusA